jgi:hypothetical protein
VENIDNFNDIIHIKLEPIYVYPTWTGIPTIHAMLDFLPLSFLLQLLEISV